LESLLKPWKWRLLVAKPEGTAKPQGMPEILVAVPQGMPSLGARQSLKARHGTADPTRLATIQGFYC